MTPEPSDAAVLSSTGHATLARGDYDAAKLAFEAALAIQRAALGGDHADVADTLNQLGRISLEQGDHGAALAYFEEVLAIRRRVFGEDHKEVAAILNNLGILHKENGDFAQARRCHLRALEIRLCDPAANAGLIGYSYSNLGAVARNQGDYRAARDYFERAVPVLVAAYGESHVSVAAVMSNLGTLLTQLGDYAGARACHERALAIRRAGQGEDHPGVGNALINLGFMLIASGDAAAARPHFERALAIFRHALGETNLDVASCLSNLGQIEAAASDWAAARRYQEAALAMREALLGRDHVEIALALVELAMIEMHDRKGGDARAHLSRALAIASLPDGAAARRHVWLALSRVEAAEGQVDTAIFFGKQAVNAVQGLRGDVTVMAREDQLGFARANEAAYRHLSGLLAGAGRLAEAERVIAMLKEEELFELLRRDAADDPRLSFVQLTALEARWQRHGDDLVEALSRLMAEAAALRDMRDDATERVAAIEREIGTVRDRLDIWLGDVLASFATSGSLHRDEIAALNRTALADVQAGLRSIGPRIALVHFVPAAQHMTIIVTTARFQVSREVAIGEGVLNRLVHELRVAIEHQTDDVRLLAMRLERFLVAPIADLIERYGIKALMLAPLGALRYLPFGALHDGRRYLVERVGLTLYTAAARSRPVGSVARGGAWAVAAFGVAREIPPHRPLAMVATELACIVADQAAGTSGVFPGSIYLDEAFTAASLAAGLERHAVVHVASHFVLAPAHQAHSYLLLGDGTQLTLEALRTDGFRFGQVDLMTLSACETAMAGGAGGEFEAFGALVQRRGARAVLATLWPVADASTPLLMKGFYRACRDGRWKHEALRAAQCAMIATGGEMASPYHWAGFVLMGNAP